jgi:hypothetical protein
MKVESLSGLLTSRLYPLGNIPRMLVGGRILAMKNFNNSIGNRNRDLPVCTAMPQTTAPPCASSYTET